MSRHGRGQGGGNGCHLEFLDPRRSKAAVVHNPRRDKRKQITCDEVFRKQITDDKADYRNEKDISEPRYSF